MTSHALAIVEVGHQTLLLPRAKAIKILELLSEAIYCRRDWESGGGGDARYIAGQPVEVEMRFVAPSQIDMPGGVVMPGSRQRARTKTVTDQPLRIQHK